MTPKEIFMARIRGIHDRFAEVLARKGKVVVTKDSRSYALQKTYTRLKWSSVKFDNLVKSLEVADGERPLSR